MGRLREYGPVTTLPATAVPPAPATGMSTCLQLVCHPASPCTPPLSLSCTVSVDAGQPATLQLRYHLQGDMGLLCIPEPALPQPADGLWQHTCFEVFARAAGAATYREFNFSPSGEWAAYRFSALRVRDLAAESGSERSRPQLRLKLQPNELVLHASLALDALPPAAAGEPLWLAVSAVLEQRDGQLSYWALHHPVERPDFHHPGGFVHALPLPAAA